MSNKIILIVAFPIVLFISLLITTFLIGLFQNPSNKICIQMIDRACFLKTPICYHFPTPCDTPPLWY